LIEERQHGQSALGGLQTATAANAVIEADMALTKSFKELVQRRVADDPAFGGALLREAIDTMLAGDVETGKAVLRDYIKATIGFEKLAAATGTPSKSLIRMFGPRGNPQARNLFGIIGYLQRQAGVEFHVTPEPR
jgi:DNA-binding phage protein